jgi:hypothetical protein
MEGGFRHWVGVEKELMQWEAMFVFFLLDMRHTHIGKKKLSVF